MIFQIVESEKITGEQNSLVCRIILFSRINYCLQELTSFQNSLNETNRYNNSFLELHTNWLSELNPLVQKLKKFG